ncbi:aryl hydrocarbon receptor-like isoform X2 [Boleophthalmus pectinirostris]|uniref:aryl hydrocarbon receptor-like isoform X2 n=1 Tax=Boleophthalmus pectinirostris TaxID=150288 RepID=UPI00242A68F8|nr:aryl hydrocarbon receptor-like isoform X2 [Boleophthalmus pectinirostris]
MLTHFHYFAATIKNGNNSLMLPGVNGQNGNNGLMVPGLSGQNNNTDIAGFSEGDLLLQALNGFVMVVTTDGLVFYTSPTIKDYLGFQQSDVVHQSVFELIHTDDREMFRQQLHFALNPPEVPDEAGLQGCAESVSYNPDQLPPENSSFLERSFVCRFRCLLDNSSGFLALKFQGRLKYLHGQSVLRDNGTRSQPQLALFSIAMPVQPSTIVEIRAKMLLFQTKHKLDFTPTGVDGRGKIILGYSEIELCMKGSGYQFIHAADMMYCADNHIRMIKTGESGLTVFRLLTKSGGWIWVKSNAKLIFKGGRPEFIIAYQKALVNAEGEEYLRQRRLQLPFSFTSGEALLYNNSPTVDLAQIQFNSQFGSTSSTSSISSPNAVFPGSLVDSFLKQDPTVYSKNIEAPLPVDQVFMDSRALVTVTNDSWQENGVSPTAGQPVVVKEEAKQSVMAIIDGLEKMAQNGNFADMLQNVDVPEEELIEWENALKRINQDDGDLQGDVRAELDEVLTNEIFDYIDSVLFKEKDETDLNSSPPSCLAGVSNMPDAVTAPQLFQSPSPGCAFSPVNVLYTHPQKAVTPPASAPIFNGTQQLCHPPLLPDTNMPPLQQLQLQDIFSPSIELPELSVSDASVSDASLKYASRQTSNSHMGGSPGIPGQPQLGQSLLSPQNNLQEPTMAGNRQLLCGPVQQHNSLSPHVMDILPPLVPCNDLNSTTAPNITVPFSTKGQGGSHFEPMQQVQQWPQSQQQRLPHCGIAQNGHDPIPACHSLSPESQTFPHAGHLPRSVNGLSHIQQQGGLACGQTASHSSCMYNQAFSSSQAGGDGFTFSGSLSLSDSDSSLDQTAPQNPCYFQWRHSEPGVCALGINQDNNVNPNQMTFTASMPSTEHGLSIQSYLECQKQTQDKAVAGEHNRSFFCSGCSHFGE